MSAVTATVAPLGPDLVRARRRRPAPRPRPDARPFDPRRPGRLPAAHRRALVLVFEAFARSLASTLAGQLRTPATVALRAVDPQDYVGLIAGAGEPTWIAAVGLGPAWGSGVLEMPLPLAMLVAERLLGGEGAGPHPQRTLTDLELVLVRRLLDVCLLELASALAPLCEVRAQVTRVEQQAELLKAAPPSEAYAVMVLAIELPETGCPAEELTLALPVAGLEPAFEAFAGSAERAPVLEAAPASIGEHLLDASVEISLRVGPMTMRAGEVVEFRPGQLLHLGHRTASPLSIDVEGVPFLPARAGHIGRRLACVVVDPAAPAEGAAADGTRASNGGAHL